MKRALQILGAVLLLFVIALATQVRLDRPAAEVEARRATAGSRFLVVDGLRIHYQDHGDGPVIVLLHGSNASLYTWSGWIARLSTDHRVIALDLPGHGLTGPDPKRRYEAGEMADVLELFLTRLGVTHFTLAGNSMGGHVAWRYAEKHPDRVERLILVDSAGLPRDEPPPLGFRLFGLPVLGTLAEYVAPRFMIEGSLREAYGDGSKVTEGDVDVYEDILLRAGNRRATHQRFQRPAYNADAVAHLSDLRMPTLILWGGSDRWILPKYGERLHDKIPGSRLVVLPGLGHACMEEDPDRTVAEVRRFLEETK